MLVLIARRLVSMVLVMLTISVILFVIFESNKQAVAIKVLGPYSSQEQRDIWIEQQGMNRPMVERYTEWLGRTLTGDFGVSIQKREPVADLLFGRADDPANNVTGLQSRLANTGILAGVVFLFMIPIALGLGIIAGMKEGSLQDRVTTVFSVLTTSIPEFASATFLLAVFVFGLGWLPGTSSFTNGFSWRELVLPVAVLVLYDVGYVARMTRASMAEVMTSQYIRTAVLKGVPRRQVIFRHALRNALIAPFTVIVLQLNWLLSGVIVVEVFFNYNGFGKLLLEAALYGDFYVVQACTIIAVVVAVGSQLISDIGYMLLNPRIRFS